MGLNYKLNVKTLTTLNLNFKFTNFKILIFIEKKFITTKWVKIVKYFFEWHENNLHNDTSRRLDSGVNNRLYYL